MQQFSTTMQAENMLISIIRIREVLNAILRDLIFKRILFRNLVTLEK